MTDKILKVQSEWMDILFKECSLRFAAVHLPSHDQWHHLRVWHFAKQILCAAEAHGMNITEADIENLIIAVFFHDQGMSETPSKKHGSISSNMCSNFFASGKYAFTPSSALLKAIEEHDRKEYGDTSSTKTFDLQKFVSIADDLDAFGITGTYRYMEIYLLRQTNVLLLPSTILENIGSRYRHFIQSFMFFEPLIKNQKPRYEKTVAFFNNLQAQLNNEGFHENEMQGSVGVLNIIRNEIIEAKKFPDTIVNFINEKESPYGYGFFRELRSEYILTSTFHTSN